MSEREESIIKLRQRVQLLSNRQLTVRDWETLDLVTEELSKFLQDGERRRLDEANAQLRTLERKYG